jgi:chemotaxis receptor (MCP) glutamine deamidase CheD
MIKPPLYLNPGGYFFGQLDGDLITLLGSCVSLCAWHSEKRLLMASHVVLPERPSDMLLKDTRYGDVVLQCVLADIYRHKTLASEYKLALFGGSTTIYAQNDYKNSVITAGVFVAGSIKVAEAAKVIENTQRDLNIALMNELAVIFDQLDIDTQDVLEAASTKWNFLPFKPGLVGGHCIGVDPYYLTHKAEELGYKPNLILGARQINNGMGKYIADKTIKLMIEHDTKIKDANVLILGLTFKEDQV